MKKLFSLIILSIIFVSPVLAVEFVEGMEDLPIMTGLEQIQSDNISFGNEETLFVEAYFSGNGINFKNVSRFYQETLPQLGWKFINKKGNILHFERDMEILDIAQEKQKPLLVRITLKSKD